jgi:hypothetical protein
LSWQHVGKDKVILYPRCCWSFLQRRLYIKGGRPKPEVELANPENAEHRDWKENWLEERSVLFIAPSGVYKPVEASIYEEAKQILILLEK